MGTEIPQDTLIEVDYPQGNLNLLQGGQYCLAPKQNEYGGQVALMTTNNTLAMLHSDDNDGKQTVRLQLARFPQPGTKQINVVQISGSQSLRPDGQMNVENSGMKMMPESHTGRIDFNKAQPSSPKSVNPRLHAGGTTADMIKDLYTVIDDLDKIKAKGVNSTGEDQVSQAIDQLLKVHGKDLWHIISEYNVLNTGTTDEEKMKVLERILGPIPNNEHLAKVRAAKTLASEVAVKTIQKAPTDEEALIVAANLGERTIDANGVSPSTTIEPDATTVNLGQQAVAVEANQPDMAQGGAVVYGGVASPVGETNAVTATASEGQTSATVLEAAPDNARPSAITEPIEPKIDFEQEIRANQVDATPAEQPNLEALIEQLNFPEQSAVETFLTDDNRDIVAEVLALYLTDKNGDLYTLLEERFIDRDAEVRNLVQPGSTGEATAAQEAPAIRAIQTDATTADVSDKPESKPLDPKEALQQQKRIVFQRLKELSEIDQVTIQEFYKSMIAADGSKTPVVLDAIISALNDPQRQEKQIYFLLRDTYDSLVSQNQAASEATPKVTSTTEPENVAEPVPVVKAIPDLVAKLLPAETQDFYSVYYLKTGDLSDDLKSKYGQIVAQALEDQIAQRDQDGKDILDRAKEYLSAAVERGEFPPDAVKL